MRHLATLILMAFTLMCVSAESIRYTTSIEEVLAQAKKLDKRIFVRFDASGCVPCQILDDQLSFHPEIVRKTTKLYHSIKLDYEDPENKEWIEKYNVDLLPTMIIIDETGKEIDRLDGYISMDRLQVFLKNNRKNNGNHTSAFLVKLQSKDLPENKKQKTNFVSTSPSDDNYIIQFGAFSSFTNAQRLSSRLRNEENIHTVIIPEYSEGKRLYKVRQTSFKAGSSGKICVNTYKERGIECMLKKM